MKKNTPFAFYYDVEINTYNQPLTILTNFNSNDPDQNNEEFLTKYKDFLNNTICFFTDGSKTEHFNYVGSATHSPTLNWSKLAKIKAQFSIFSAETYAIIMSLDKITEHNTLNPNHLTYSIFSDSRSVLQSICSINYSSDNYLIYECKLRLINLNDRGCKVNLIWIPSPKGILGNEEADNLANQARSIGELLLLKIPQSDFLELINRKKRDLFTRALKKHENSNKGSIFFNNYYNSELSKPWFWKFEDITRIDIVLINRLRSNHFSLNASLFEKKIIESPLCDCEQGI